MDDEKAVDAEIKEIHIFDGYDIREKQNDIALLQLKNPLSIGGDVIPACLYTQDDNPSGLIITGWGRATSNGNDLQQTQTP